MATPDERNEVFDVFMARLANDFPEAPLRIRKAKARELTRNFFNDKKAGLLPLEPSVPN